MCGDGCAELVGKQLATVRGDIGGNYLRAGVQAGLVWAATDLGIAGEDLVYAVFVLTVATGMLMVSNIRYFSFKEFNFKNRVPVVALLLVVLIYAFASIDPPKVLFAGFMVYVISGIVYTLVGIRNRRKLRRRSE